MAVSVTAQNLKDVSNLYVALFGRAPDGEGLGFWANLLANGTTMTSVADQMYAVPAARPYYPSFFTNQQIVDSFYLKVLGRVADTEGSAYWTAKLNAPTATPGSVITEMVSVVLNWTPSGVPANAAVDAAGALSKSLFTNKADVSLYFGLTNGTVAGGQAALNGVDATAASVTAAKAVIDGGSSATAQTFMLTTGFDNLVGSAGADTFIANVVQNNNGEQTNQLATGDHINGGGGTDTLNAVVQMASALNNSPASAITPITTSVEKAMFTALTVNNVPYTFYNSDSNHSTVVPYAAETVNINAKSMTGLTAVGSVQSDASLLIQNLTTLTDSGVYADRRNTDSITIRMDHTGNDIAVDAESNMTVLFDNDYLLSSQIKTNTLEIRLANNLPLKNANTPLVGFDSVSFKVGSVNVVVPVTAAMQALVGPAAYAALQVAIQAQLTSLSITDVAVNLLTPEPTVFSIPLGGNALGSVAGVYTPIQVVSTGGALAKGTIGQASDITDYNGVNTESLGAQSTVNNPVTSNIELFKVGRGAEGGSLVVGGMSTDLANVWDYSTTALKEGVEQFNVKVLGDSTQMSSLSNLSSTNNTLKTVNVVTDAAQTGTYADLAIGNHNTSGYALKDVQTLDASGFKGKLSVDAAVTAETIGKYLNLKDIQALPAGDNVAFVYTGGSNNDTMAIQIDGGVAGSRSTIIVGREDFTFTANGGAGDDVITLTMVNPQSGNMAGGAQAWYNNQKLNANVFVNGGDGNDTITTPGAGDVKIDAGAGNDTVYADNTGDLGVSAMSGSAASTSAVAYAQDDAAELASSIAVATLADATSAATTTAAAAALNTLNLVTPVAFPVAAITHATMQTAIQAAATAGAITLAQQIALDTAYNVATTETITVPTTLVAPAITGTVAVGGNLTAAEFAAGNALLDTYIAAAKAAAATATAADANTTTQTAVLDGTQGTVQTDTLAMTGLAGTATRVANLAALSAALVVGATDAQVVAALQLATKNGAIGAGVDATLFAQAVATAGTMDGTELANTNLILAPLVNAAANANTAAQTALTAAIVANNTAVDAASTAGSVVIAGNAVTEATTAAAALKTYNTGTLTPATTIASDLATLKAALSVGISDLNFSLATTNAVAKGTIAAGDKTALDLAATFGATPAVGGTLDATEKTAVDLLMTALQLTSETDVAAKTLVSGNLASISAAAAMASSIAAAANASGSTTLTIPAPTAVFVFNTTNQLASYDLLTMDDRNLADLKSDANDNMYNMYNEQLTVTFKGLTSTVTVPSTGYHTSDLQVNQAMKAAINDPLGVLSKLLVATDGPANTLVVTSLIDGKMVVGDLAVSLANPAVGSLVGTDIAAAAAVYGSAATEAGVLAAMSTSLTAFNTKGDYVTQFAESGAAGGNKALVGAPSTSTSDNIITGGTGNDVLVFGTTVGTDAMTSSNDTAVYTAAFGNDTIVHFTPGAMAMGGDVLNLSGLGGNVLSAAFNVNKSVNVATEVAATNGTAALVAALYTDSATAQTHVYAAVDATGNTAKIYAVVDPAGVATNSVTATLMGTIDLADTQWSALTAVNFA